VTPRIRVQTDDFDVGQEHGLLAQSCNSGALVTFTGMVRDLANGTLHGLTLEHYPGMTERHLAALVDEATSRWMLNSVTVIHRVGHLARHEQIVFVGVASAHRAEAFAAASYLMDMLKTQAPFWKKEHTAAGDYWVEARHSDDAAAARWQPASAPE
jgi:molybdopterin synthase catalytic subunit